MQQAVVVLSGGLDSTTLLYDVIGDFGKDQVFAITFDYGQRHDKEILAAIATCNQLEIKHQIVNIRSLKELFGENALTSDAPVPEGHYTDDIMKLTVVPNRNMILLSVAVGYAFALEAQYVYYGVHSGDHAIYPDCRPEFFEAMKAAVSLSDWKKVELCAPYLHWSKNDIVVRGKELKVNYKFTWTCYKGLERPCGKCGSCVERAEAFAAAKMKDPLLF